MFIIKKFYMADVTNSFYKFGSQVDFDSLLLENLKNSVSNCYYDFYKCNFFFNNNNNTIKKKTPVKKIKEEKKSLDINNDEKEEEEEENTNYVNKDDDDDNNSTNVNNNNNDNNDNDNSFIDKKKIWNNVEQIQDLDLMYKSNNKKIQFYTETLSLVTKSDIQYLENIIE